MFSIYGMIKEHVSSDCEYTKVACVIVTST